LTRNKLRVSVTKCNSVENVDIVANRWRQLPINYDFRENGHCGRRRRRREVPEGIPRSINVGPNILCNDRIKQQRPFIGEQSIA